MRSLTLEEIQNTPQLTPQRFAQFFSRFEFKFHSEIQAPAAFLASESGDCDDYSILAAEVLRKRGYTPRLIAVRMPGVVHVVCFVPEVNGYLDYNMRARVKGVIACESGIADVARSVAGSYHAKWSSASEFTYEDGAKHLVQTVLDRRDKQFAAVSR